MSEKPLGCETSGRRMDGPGVAAACLGVCLLAGTVLSGALAPDPPVAAIGFPHAVSVREDGTHGRAASRGEQAPPPVDINRADAPALEALPGIGPALARRIVAHRDLHGPFARPLDLLQVSGVGAKRYAGLQGRITTAGTP